MRLDWRNLPDAEAAHEMAKEFVKNGADLIVAFEDQTVRAAKAATTEIPVVFLHVGDPVAAGFVQSLPHPGGNLTGLAGSSGNLLGKQIELFKELVPQLRRLLLLMNPEDPRTAPSLIEARKVSKGLKIELVERKVTNQPDIEHVFSSVKADSINGPSCFLDSPLPDFTPLSSVAPWRSAYHLQATVKSGWSKADCFLMGPTTEMSAETRPAT